jgi:dipeptide/tripeptide permease
MSFSLFTRAVMFFAVLSTASTVAVTFSEETVALLTSISEITLPYSTTATVSPICTSERERGLLPLYTPARRSS